MAKSKESKDEEFYKGKIRELDKLVKALRKHIRQLEKEKYRWEKQTENEEDYHIVEKEEPTKVGCPKCVKGSLTFSDLGIKILKVCNTCGWRKTESK